MDNPEEKPLKPPVTGVTIRAMRASDIEAVTAMLNLPGFRHGTLRLPYQSVEETRKRFESMPQGNVSIVAEVDGVPIGDAHLMRLLGRRSHAASIGMGVHDNFTGKGVGSALMQALVDTADNWLDIKRLELTVYTDNAAALALYKKFGFETEGLLKSFGFRDGAYVDAYTMARVRL
ncbi:MULTISPECIES: GNAT family N-acetyltransferase [unclassified Rhizobium]|uniref:GNAT family N-acetyltransferase n=2 Tax=Rhizobium TaxID=379 RepID=UPI0016157769|nr:MULTISPECIES: GNAT family N-acetyltransferase [unclassified Rhizobium]MBB3540713.1 putative acetyltransferase [Rhizobium sp. BK399]MCS3742440.1 putative acetyltransferase [Rhizobium sp. BK661]MCS4092776.1 putative acetyltransferase [Rhizobium sp. BK176]